MSAKIFRAKAHDLQRAARKYNIAPVCGDDDELPPDGEEIPEDEVDESDEERDPDPAGDEPVRASDSVRPPIRLVIRPRPSRSRAA